MNDSRGRDSDRAGFEQRIAAHDLTIRDKLASNLAKLADLSEASSQGLPTALAELDKLTAQARSAAVALNGSGLVALVALAGVESLDPATLRLSVTLMFLGLFVGLAAWFFRVLFHASQVELLRSFPILKERAEALQQHYEQATGGGPPNETRSELIRDVSRLVRKERVVVFAATVIAESLSMCRRMEGFGLVASIALFIAAVAIPTHSFVAG